MSVWKGNHAVAVHMQLEINVDVLLLRLTVDDITDYQSEDVSRKHK